MKPFPAVPILSMWYFNPETCKSWWSEQLIKPNQGPRRSFPINSFTVISFTEATGESGANYLSLSLNKRPWGLWPISVPGYMSEKLSNIWQQINCRPSHSTKLNLLQNWRSDIFGSVRAKKILHFFMLKTFQAEMSHFGQILLKASRMEVPNCYFANSFALDVLIDIGNNICSTKFIFLTHRDRSIHIERECVHAGQGMHACDIQFHISIP